MGNASYAIVVYTMVYIILLEEIVVRNKGQRKWASKKEKVIRDRGWRRHQKTKSNNKYKKPEVVNYCGCWYCTHWSENKKDLTKEEHIREELKHLEASEEEKQILFEISYHEEDHLLDWYYSDNE